MVQLGAADALLALPRVARPYDLAPTGGLNGLP
jgi:hypothetical protein